MLLNPNVITSKSTSEKWHPSYQEMLSISLPFHEPDSSSVAERPLCDGEVLDSVPGWVIPKTLKMVLLSFRHHSERRFFAWRFISDENILF